jgi:hypothetical protein
VTKTVLTALLFVAIGAACASAQEQPPVPPPTPQSTPPPAVPPPGEQPPVAQTPAAQEPLPAVAAADAPPRDADTLRRRRSQMRIMEGVLIGAVRGAAQEIASELQTPDTGPFLLSGSLVARGFILEDYGVFFHVEIPGVQPSLISPVSVETLQRMAQARQAQPEAASTGSSMVRVPLNANAEYVERVKDALVRAMVEHSKPLELRADEWFTVAAGDGDEPLNLAVLAQQAIMVLRVRGRDIAEYMAGRLTLDEVRRKVEVRKF